MARDSSHEQRAVVIALQRQLCFCHPYSLGLSLGPRGTRLLPTTYCLLPTTYVLLPTTYYLLLRLLATYYLLPTATYLPATTYYYYLLLLLLLLLLLFEARERSALAAFSPGLASIEGRLDWNLPVVCVS